ncbi:Protein YceI [Corynebacterium provencense]|jgi:polyisoprenoid-binding protein YceI|uniref:Protein YceI n=2 Tax=Corynebacteriaceae TaxID=1653 RepID=A0A2Z3YUI1_9CORY|nr:Protein YceI [Corynebacterium provencense]
MRVRGPVPDNMVGMRKGLVTLFVVAVIAMAVGLVAPPVYRLITSHGLQTASIADGSGEPASVGVDGHWSVIPGVGANRSQAGYTFDEVLPGQAKTTSGRGEGVTGDLIVNDGTLTEGTVTVDVNSIGSDIEKRDINVRRHILQTDLYPDAVFEVTKPADLSALPDDGTAATVKLTGDLTLHGETRQVSADLKVLRTGENVIVEGKLPVVRKDFGLQSPQFVASQIADDGTIDLLLVLALS